MNNICRSIFYGGRLIFSTSKQGQHWQPIVIPVLANKSFNSQRIHNSVVTYNKSDGDLRKLTSAEWLKRLTPEQFSICREKGTEEPFSGKYCVHGEAGIYSCVCCGATLFSSKNKFESNSGWPAFNAAYGSDSNGEIEVNVLRRADNSVGMSRTEVMCKKCHAHVGHVFEDGPPPTGERYCINSVALSFETKKITK